MKEDRSISFITPNEFSGSDSERINQAVAEGATCGLRVVVPRMNQSPQGTKPLWILDSAILLPGNTTLELQDCHIKLSDQCRDNFIRSANCGKGITEVTPLRNIHILGSGSVLLEGADHPRATGDSAKSLGKRSYGTDAGVEGENQFGDWRNIGILMAYVENFSLVGITIKDSHCWAVSLERCAHGRICDLEFASNEHYTIDGEAVKFLNQDGLDLRQGCHDITIDGISGYAGDDLVAFTAISWNGTPAEGLSSSMVTPANNRGDGLDDIHHITLRNVRGHSRGGHHIVRLLNAGGLCIHNILIDGIQDTSTGDRHDRAALKIGDGNPAWGGVAPLGDTRHIAINNIISRAENAILIGGSLSESVINNIVCTEGALITYQSGAEHVRDVLCSNVLPPASSAD